MWPPVAWFATLYVAGLGLGLALGLPAVPMLLTAATALAVGWRAGWRHRLLAALLAGCALGAVTADRRSRACAAQWTLGPHAAVLRVHDSADPHGRTEATVVHAPEGCHGVLRVRTTSQSLAAGTTVVAVGTHHRRGWFRLTHARPLRGFRRPLRHRVRESVSHRITRLYGARAPLVEAIVLGRRAGLDPEIRDRFAAGGLAHLLAISGLHVGVIAAWVRTVVGRITRRRTSWLVSAVSTWMYVGLLGFPAAATRAATVISLYAAARSRERRPAASAVIAVAALGVVTVDPLSLQAAGAWLSVAAVTGIEAARRWLRLARPRGAWVGWVAASTGATIATAPITAFVFGSVAPVGIVANLAGVPLAAVAVPGVFASLLFGSSLAGGAGLALAGLERLAEVAAGVPWGHLTGEPGIPFALPFVCLALVAAWVSWRRPLWRVLWRRVLVVVAVIPWLVVAWPHGGGAPEGWLIIHVLSVGQGDAVLIRTPGGQWIVVDAGPRFGSSDAGRSVVLPFLRRRGVTRTAVALASHGDADHLGGMPALVTATRPALVVEPGQPLGTALYQEFLGAVNEAAGRWQVGRAGDTVVVDSIVLAVLHPSAEWMAQEARPNENSLVLQLVYGDFDMLLMGDAGWPAESLLAATLPGVDLLKVGHHGSAGSTSERFLDVIRPAAAVISVGRNRFGHPTPEVLNRLRARGVAVYRTDREGTVTIRTNGDYFEISPQQPPQLAERIRCLFRTWSRSSDSSSDRSACTRTRPASSRTFSTTPPSPRRSSRATSAAPG